MQKPDPEAVRDPLAKGRTPAKILVVDDDEANRRLLHEMLAADGYEAYVKPFRTIEDLHVHAAIIAYLVREARRQSWPNAWVERAVGVLHAARALAAEKTSAPATHIALAGVLSCGTTLVTECGNYWQSAAGDPAAERWLRDRELLGVAGSARVQRTSRAWERLGSPGP